MSKSDLGHDVLQDQLTTAEDERLAQRSSEIFPKSNRSRDSVTPFAKDMVENVVTGALSILDISRKEGKPWKEVLSASKNPSGVFAGQDIPSVDKGGADFHSYENQTLFSLSSSDAQRPVVQVMHLRVPDDVVCDSVHAEQVAKIVKGLQDIQIGDSTYVLPADGSNIEKQVKRAVRNINSLEFGDMETAQLIICDGQGDVDAKILEAEVGPPSNGSSKPQNDASRVSTCYLHKMIEELEDNDSTKGISPEHGNKEGIASWEESEEKFIRIIEGPSDERYSAQLDHQECHHPVIFDQELLALGVDNHDGNKNFVDSLGQIQQAFSKEEEIDERENDHRPRNRLDNYIDEEPYWCTVGLIARAVLPQRSDVCLTKTTMAGEESGPLELGGNLQGRKTEISIRETLSIAEHAEEDKESKTNGKKKTSLGKRLRKFFSRFKRTRNS